MTPSCKRATHYGALPRAPSVNEALPKDQPFFLFNFEGDLKRRGVHHVTDSVDFGGQLLFAGDLLLQVIHGSAPAGFTVEQVLGQHSQFLQSAHGQSLICGFLFAR